MRDHDLNNELIGLHLRLLTSLENRAPRSGHVPLLLRNGADYVFDTDRLTRNSHLATLAAIDRRIRGSR